MNMDNNSVDCDPSIKPVVFVYKETPREKYATKACPSCKSTRIYHKKSKVDKKCGRGPVSYKPSHYHCYICKNDFAQPIHVETTRGSIKELPEFLKGKVKYTPAILSPSEKPAK